MADKQLDVSTTPRQPVRIAPARTPEMGADVHVVGCRAALTALSFGLIASTVTAAVCIIAQAGTLITLGAITAAGWCTFAVTFAVDLPHEKALLGRAQIWEYERQTGKDIDGDGIIGKPPPADPLVISANANSTSLSVAGQEERFAQLDAFIDAIYERNSTTESTHIEGRGMDRDSQYVPFRDALIRGGYARWISQARPNAGWRMIPGQTPESVKASVRGLLLREADNQLVYEMYLANGGPDAFRRR